MKLTLHSMRLAIQSAPEYSSLEESSPKSNWCHLNRRDREPSFRTMAKLAI